MPLAYLDMEGTFHRTQKQAGDGFKTFMFPNKHQNMIDFLNREGFGPAILGKQQPSNDKAAPELEPLLLDTPFQPKAKRRYIKRGSMKRSLQFAGLLAQLKFDHGPNASAKDEWFSKQMNYGAGKASTYMFVKRLIEEGYLEPRPFLKANWITHPLMFTPAGHKRFLEPLLEAKRNQK